MLIFITNYFKKIILCTKNDNILKCIDVNGINIKKK